MFAFSKTVTVAGFAALGFASLIQAQLPLIVLGDDATCPAPAPGATVGASVLAVVNFVETATATVTVGDIVTARAPLSVDLEVCLCVTADAELGTITLPANLDAEATADIEAYAAANADVSALADAFNNVIGLGGANVALTLVPTQRTDCTCPANATPTCADGQCSCICPTGFFYDAASGRCILNASALTRRANAQAKRSEIVKRLKRN